MEIALQLCWGGIVEWLLVTHSLKTTSCEHYGGAARKSSIRYSISELGLGVLDTWDTFQEKNNFQTADWARVFSHRIPVACCKKATLIFGTKVDFSEPSHCEQTS